MKALVTERVDADTVLHAFPLLRPLDGRGPAQVLPEGAHPVVRGEAINTATTYGYDSVTMMQETKTTMCQVVKDMA